VFICVHRWLKLFRFALRYSLIKFKGNREGREEREGEREEEVEEFLATDERGCTRMKAGGTKLVVVPWASSPCEVCESF